jgi:hypothetical protein
VRGRCAMAKTMPASTERAEAEEEEITFHVMSPEESWEGFDQAAQLYLHMSGEAFLKAWDAGEFDENPDRPEVMRLVLLRPFGR